MNLYAYVGNNPFNRTDPTGMVADDALRLGGNIAGGARAGTAAINASAVGLGTLVYSSSLNENEDAAIALIHGGAIYHSEVDDADSIPDKPDGKISIPSESWWKDKGVDPHTEKEGYGDSKRNLGVDKKGNIWAVDRKGSGNPEYIGNLRDFE
ncbi:hypothetical protein D3C81_1526610 [compost metagenome]